MSQQLRRIRVSQIEAMNNELDSMLEQDIIKEVTEASPWVSNLVIIPQKSGDIRVCCDLREVNKAVIRERYILPKIDDTLHAMRGSKYFANIDAKSGFFQFTLAEESRYVTMFITPRGCYRFKRNSLRSSSVLRFCGNFYFNSRYCGFKTLSSLRLLQPLSRSFR